MQSEPITYLLSMVVKYFTL